MSRAAIRYRSRAVGTYRAAGTNLAGKFVDASPEGLANSRIRLLSDSPIGDTYKRDDDSPSMIAALKDLYDSRSERLSVDEDTLPSSSLGPPTNGVSAPAKGTGRMACIGAITEALALENSNLATPNATVESLVKFGTTGIGAAGTAN